MKKIIRNAIRCNQCGETIVSNNLHDFVTCICGTCSIDGGSNYLRRLAPTEEAYTDLSIVEED